MPTPNDGTVPNDSTLPPSGNDDLGGQKRPVEERIDQLIAQIKGGEEEKLRMQQKIVELEQRVPPPPPPAGNTPEVQKAIDALKGLGFVQKNDLEDRARAIEDRYALNAEHARFENEFDGNDGRPRYDRSSVEKFMKDRAIYDPLAAYKLMHEPELLDWTIKQKENEKNPSIHVEAPGRRGLQEDDDTQLMQKLKEHSDSPTEASKIWYEENRFKILNMMATGKLN